MIAFPSPRLAHTLRKLALPVEGPLAEGELAEIIGEARIVMLGEATHGTAEFYDWRRTISIELLRDHNFSFIAVEGDWPDCQRVHRHVTTGTGDAREALAGYRRFPTWMWGNRQVLELVEWMQRFNKSNAHDRMNWRARPAGFHGLDVYSLYDSMQLVVDYLERIDPAAARRAKEAYSCFDAYGKDFHRYALATRLAPANCEADVTAALTHLHRLGDIYSRISPDHENPTDAYFDATMNALVTRNAEAYYRAMMRGDAESWNVRDQHMLETLELLLDRYGADSRAIIWAHNTHIGDYRATDMLSSGYVNLGGLARERFGEDAVRLIGFTTYHGSVVAASGWGEDPQMMQVPPAREGSLEGLLHDLDLPRAMIPIRGQPPETLAALSEEIGHRAIGVVYDPDRERMGQYVPTRLAGRYDGLYFIDRTEAVTPLAIPVDLSEEPESWPSGL